MVMTEHGECEAVKRYTFALDLDDGALRLGLGPPVSLKHDPARAALELHRRVQRRMSDAGEPYHQAFRQVVRDPEHADLVRTYSGFGE